MILGLEYDFERVRRVWPRLYRALLEDVRYAFHAYEIIAAIEKRLARELPFGEAVKKEPHIDRMPRAAREVVFAAAKDDAKKRDTLDLLSTIPPPSLDELLTEIRSSSPLLATTACEAGESLRPRFSSVGRTFVSYASADGAAHAQKVVAFLEGRGVKCWIAPRDIGGERPNDAMHAAVTECLDLVLVFTEAVPNSTFVFGEVNTAIVAGRRVLTLLMQPGLDPPKFHISLPNWQYLECWRNMDSSLEELLKKLRP